MTLRDYEGRAIRLTPERLQHILEHPEMKGMTHRISETLHNPMTIIQSRSDPEARLYYRYYLRTAVGNKLLCVVVKMSKNDAFVLTAYLTNSIGKGEILWPKKK